MMLKTLILFLLALPVLYRVARTLHFVRRAGFVCVWRYQAFALGHAALGGLTSALVFAALAGEYVPWRDIGFLAAFASMSLFDPRRAK